MPNGTYVVRVVAGDASHFESVFRTTVEGALTVTGTPTTTTRWIEGTSTVTVTDGGLTIRSGAGASNNREQQKVCFGVLYRNNRKLTAMQREHVAAQSSWR